MTNEERLKRIKDHAETDVIEWDEDRTVERVDWLFEGDFDWLVEQAENFEKVFDVVNDFKSGEISLGEFIDDLMHLIKD